MSVLPIATVFFDLGDTLVQSRDWVPGAKAALAALKQRSVRLGVLSNTANLSRRELSTLLPPDFRFETFEAELVLLSSEVGLEKPSPAIFALAVERSGVEPARCLYCSESLEETLAAQASGMRAVRLLKPPDSEIAELADGLARVGLVG
jgi:FMN phosphatase YigB (HAD superfamily)